MKIINRILCYKCGSNCDLYEVKEGRKVIICRECIDKFERLKIVWRIENED
jgi:formylmethanofuran dehydrogenase subunit B